ncbi:hypothetical protein [Streptomyces sp. NRRL S-1521]|uniref:hypothetical protein n=1 Tax=Streptomyces sp. NRRL S-1521 TaxID=1609100 RepID=UPI00099E8F71|nr:hypothetical protein [Streptomyces sp. NRRL S-1521]
MTATDLRPSTAPHRSSARPGLAGIRQDPLPAGSTGGIPLTLPAAFEAFCTLNRDCYLGYAHAHLPSPAAHHALAAVFGHLVTHWPHVVSRPEPAAYAWQQLVAQVGSRSHPLPLTTDSPLQYDVVVLHYGLALPLTAIATATGQETPMISCLIRTWKASTS